MKYFLLILIMLFITSCCKPAGIERTTEIKYMYRDSISANGKANIIKSTDTLKVPYFIPYRALFNQVKPRTVFRSDGTFKTKYDSLSIEYNMLDSTFKFYLASTPDTVYQDTITKTIKPGFWEKTQWIFIGIVIGAIICFISLAIRGD